MTVKMFYCECEHSQHTSLEDDSQSHLHYSAARQYLDKTHKY